MNISKLILSLGFTNWTISVMNIPLLFGTSTDGKNDILDMISTCLSYYMAFFQV